MPPLIQQNVSLHTLNTFGMNVSASYFAKIDSLGTLQECLEAHSDLQTLILGGGSNLLFTKNFDGFVLHDQIQGIQLVHEDEQYVYVKAGGGVHWHSFVRYTIEHGWYGLENLSLIPGTVGAAPIQNIGAYGVEMENYFWSLEAWHLHDSKLQTFTKSDCKFGYRESVFKSLYKGQFFILNVTFQLSKSPRFHIEYGAIQKELESMNVKELSAVHISDAIINIRRSKLPDPAITGNAGSFFKNPIISSSHYDELKAQYPDLAAYPAGAESYKVAAGWLIEKAGWKGYREGDAGCHALQALVLVNYGHAQGSDIVALSNKIIQDVATKFRIYLEKEVNII